MQVGKLLLVGLRAALALVVAAALPPLDPIPAALAADQAKQSARIQLGEPEGFATLTDAQTAVIDVYSGGKRIGDAQITYRPGALTFADPAKLVALLPDLANVAAVRTALSVADLPSNPGLVCTPSSNPVVCGRLAPKVAGIIFDQDRFRVDVFVNPMLMTVREVVGRQYVQRPERGLSVVNAIGAVLSGSSRGPQFANVQNNLIIGDGDRRIRAEFGYATGFGVQADRLVLELDRPERRYMAGAFWAPGTDLIGRRKILGIGIESQIDTRLDKDELWGNPLVVFLNQRARIDIVRDGRVLATRIYDGGNQTLDTRTLPDGSYEVALRIEEAGGGRREERRFFSKNQNIAAPGQKIFFAYAGLLADDNRRRFIAPTSTPFFQAGLARRLSPHMAVDATVVATDRAVLGQIGAYHLSPLAQVRVAAVGASNGQYGGLLQVSSQGSSRFAFNFDLRRIRVAANAALVPSAPTTIGPDIFSSSTDGTMPLARNTFSQVSGSIAYSLPSARIGFAASYRRERNQPADYSYGPSFRWEFLRRGQLRMSANGDLAVTSQGKSGYIGLNLHLLGTRASLESSAGMRSNQSGSDARRTGAVGSLHGSWQHDNIAGGELNLGGGYERDLDRDALNANAELRGEKFSLRGDLAHNLGQSSNPTQYSIGFQTSMAVAGGRVAFKGRDRNDSMVIVKVDGAGPKDRFEVLVNDNTAGTVRGASSTVVAMPSYRQYDLRIRQTAGDLLNYDGSARRVGLFPGNVAQLKWKARKVTAMFGRLVLESGEPVRMASVTNPGGIGETDNNGYFQIEAEPGAAIDVALPGGQTCRVNLPTVQPTQGYAPLGTLICRPQAAPFMLSSAKPQ